VKSWLPSLVPWNFAGDSVAWNSDPDATVADIAANVNIATKAWMKTLSLEDMSLPFLFVDSKIKASRDSPERLSLPLNSPVPASSVKPVIAGAGQVCVSAHNSPAVPP
jgi:hypothetical protein